MALVFIGDRTRILRETTVQRFSSRRRLVISSSRAGRSPTLRSWRRSHSTAPVADNESVVRLPAADEGR